MSNVVKIWTDEEFDTIVQTAQDRLIVVDFFATWCGPCKMFEPIFNRFSITYDFATFLQVDVDQFPQLRARYNVNGFPTFVLVKNLVEVGRVRGANERELEYLLRSYDDSMLIAPEVQPVSPYKNFPPKKYLTYDKFNPKVLLKIVEFNDIVENKLTSSEIDSLTSAVNTLVNTSYYHTSTFVPEQFKAIHKIVTTWPVNSKFPGLDLLRTIILHPEGMKYYVSRMTENCPDNIFLIIQSYLFDDPETTKVINFVLIWRIFQNAFKFENYSEQVVRNIEEVISFMHPNKQKHERIAIVDLLLKYINIISTINKQVSQCM
eukprot:TRINITY_DN1100_c0_g1_i1.p1 TRINITY_DN1100_c0_g1~~TRINITY_DN1100_c0_g1_i1.p1  ORF type:complete len:319 (+),score=38.30 TRINITY_DN1100_c0_g1_i1:225-1181(+)